MPTTHKFEARFDQPASCKCMASVRSNITTLTCARTIFDGTAGAWSKDRYAMSIAEVNSNCSSSSNTLSCPAATRHGPDPHDQVHPTTWVWQRWRIHREALDATSARSPHLVTAGGASAVSTPFIVTSSHRIRRLLPLRFVATRVRLTRARGVTRAHPAAMNNREHPPQRCTYAAVDADRAADRAVADSTIPSS
jgi:hypothetical protein